MRNKISFIILIIVLSLALTACSIDNTQKNPAPENPNIVNQPTDKDITDDNLVQEGEEEIIMPMAAINIYVEKYPNNKIKEIGLDNNLGVYTYKIEGYKNGIEYEMKIDAVNGDILYEENKKEDDLDKYGDISKSDVENIGQYVNKVLENAGHGTILDEWTLKAKNGRKLLEIEVDLSNGTDIERTYDIETGELVEKND